MEKACSKCKVVKDISAYSRYKNGYKPACKKCYSLDYKLKNVNSGIKFRVDRSNETEDSKVCPKCTLLLPKVNFNSSGYCKPCTRIINRANANNKGVKERFIPIVTAHEKQCIMCKTIKNLEDYSNSKRGRLGKAPYCKPCYSLYQTSRLSKKERCLKTQKYRDNNR